MLEAIRAILTLLVGSAIVTTLLAFILNTRDERLRTLRDHITETFDETRSDIRQAVSAGVAYWNCTDRTKLPELEAQVLLYDSDVRSALAALREFCDADELAAVPKFQGLEAEFIDALTGGNFGSVPFAADPARARQIIGFGSRLRSGLARLRRHQLGRARSFIGRSVGLLVLFLTVVGITYAAGLFAGLVIPHDGPSHTRRENCSAVRKVQVKSGTSTVTIETHGPIRVCTSTSN